MDDSFEESKLPEEMPEDESSLPDIDKLLAESGTVTEAGQLVHFPVLTQVEADIVLGATGVALAVALNQVQLVNTMMNLLALYMSQHPESCETLAAKLKPFLKVNR